MTPRQLGGQPIRHGRHSRSTPNMTARPETVLCSVLPKPRSSLWEFGALPIRFACRFTKDVAMSQWGMSNEPVAEADLALADTWLAAGPLALDPGAVGEARHLAQRRLTVLSFAAGPLKFGPAAHRHLIYSIDRPDDRRRRRLCGPDLLFVRR